MSEFWIVAACMCIFALAFLAWPLWRAHEATGRWPLPGLIAAAVLIPMSVLIYQHVRTWSGPEASGQIAAVDTEQLAIVNQLAARMQENPDDIEGWMLLGRSYLTLQQYPEARMAFMQAWQRSPEPSSSLKLGLGTAMIYSDPATIRGEGGQLIEEVLVTEPRNQQALWIGGLVAADRGRLDVARTRWATLLSTNPNPELAQMLRGQIAEIDTMLGSSGAAAPPFAAQPAGGDVPADGPVITLRLSLGEAFAGENFGPDARLFIFARAQAGGPPLAVIPAAVSDLPGEFTLSDANVMIQGNRLSNFEEISLVARISRTGTPTQQPGDVFAQTRYSLADGGVVQLVLDQVAQ